MERDIKILEAELRKYARPSWNGKSFLTYDADKQAYAVVAVSIQRGDYMTALNLFVELIDDCIVIGTDRNDKPLVDALVQAGVPREKIILAYAGETLPETMDMS